MRYADDCNVYVRSRKAGERVLQALRGCYAKLAVATQALDKMRERTGIRQLTRRTRGRSLQRIAENLKDYASGWKAYFRLAQTPKVLSTATLQRHVIEKGVAGRVHGRDSGQFRQPAVIRNGSVHCLHGSVAALPSR